MTKNQETMSREDFESLWAFAESYRLMSVPLDKAIPKWQEWKKQKHSS